MSRTRAAMEKFFARVPRPGNAADEANAAADGGADDAGRPRLKALYSPQVTGVSFFAHCSHRVPLTRKHVISLFCISEVVGGFLTMRTPNCARTKQYCYDGVIGKDKALFIQRAWDRATQPDVRTGLVPVPGLAPVSDLLAMRQPKGVLQVLLLFAGGLAYHAAVNLGEWSSHAVATTRA